MGATVGVGGGGGGITLGTAANTLLTDCVATATWLALMLAVVWAVVSTNT